MPKIKTLPGATHRRLPTQARCWTPSHAVDSMPIWVAQLVTWDEDEQAWTYNRNPITHSHYLVVEDERIQVMPEKQFRELFDALPSEQTL